ncbi:hypothetical protein FOA52_007731 [Chlamydomonas sp. UWO 241]|nr:hypothetical protein FOA52_007731 [Chlamydomonas sp. UWO 241]
MLEASTTPRMYMGEMQVHFVACVLRSLLSAPVTLTGQARRQTFYERNPKWAAHDCEEDARAAAAAAAAATKLPPPSQHPPPPGCSDGGCGGDGALEQGAPPRAKKGLGALLTRLDLDMNADVLEVHHDAQDADDPSDLIFLRSSNVGFSLSFGYASGVAARATSVGTRMVPVNTSHLSNLRLEAYELRLHKPPDDSDVAAACAAAAAGMKPPRPRVSTLRQGACGDARSEAGEPYATYAADDLFGTGGGDGARPLSASPATAPAVHSHSQHSALGESLAHSRSRGVEGMAGGTAGGGALDLMQPLGPRSRRQVAEMDAELREEASLVARLRVKAASVVEQPAAPASLSSKAVKGAGADAPAGAMTSQLTETLDSLPPIDHGPRGMGSELRTMRSSMMSRAASVSTYNAGGGQ